VGEALRRVVRIGGSREAIGECRQVADAVGCAGSLDALESAWELLDAAGVADRVRVDFGILRSFDYYTGLIVEAYAPGLGLPLGGGGRYDDVLASFGAPMPAAGFALSLERVMIALAAQDVEIPVRGLDAVVGGESEQVARTAARLRAAGWTVRMSATGDAAALDAEAASVGAAWRVLAGQGQAVSADGRVLVIDPVPAPPAEGGER
jgi:ATP phosphoribosyltransferase regulatory subunit